MESQMQWPYAYPPCDDVSVENLSQWGLSVGDPVRIENPEGHEWSGEADILVVGLGGAGVAAALDVLERGLSVIALDRYEGGGSSAANGGVFYAGGGTSVQAEAGVEDSPEQMFAYLKLETENVVSDDTLHDFCQTSAATVDWMRGHGVPFEGSLYSTKTSYPPLDKYLYHPDSSLSAPYRDKAKPAARGHRGVGRNGKLAWGLGKYIFNPLKDAALARGLVLHRHSEVKQLALNLAGRVIGLRVERIIDPVQSARFADLTARADKWFSLLPPTLPGAQWSYRRGYQLMAKALEIEAKHRSSQWFRAKKGVLLSGGGFIVNKQMVAALAPRYKDGLPNGTLGDTGSGIMLGVSAGGATALMERVSAWRFLNPPLAWSQALLVNGLGARFVNETLYGAAIGDAMVEKNAGRGYVILDASARKAALKQAFGKDVLGFQRDITLFNCLIAATKARTLDALAARLGLDPATLRETVAQYNRAANGQSADVFHKSPAEMVPLGDGPYYAIDASVDSKFFPLACMTVGGLVVDETSGQVRRGDGSLIPGLYAAGRNAVGICSHLYVSGLSYADCIYSGRRVARHIAGEQTS